MKKWLSVLALEVRSSIYKLLAVFLCMTGLEMADFYRVVRTHWDRGQQFVADRQERNVLLLMFEKILGDTFVEWIFLAAFAGVSAILIWSGSEKGKVRTQETLWRLRVNPHGIFLTWSLYHLFCFWMLFVWQILLVMGMHQYYLLYIDAEMAPQALFLAFSRNSFLHGILPFADVLIHVRNLVLFIVWALGTVYFGYVGYGRHSHKCLLIAAFLVFSGMLVAIGSEVRWLDIALIILGLIYLIAMIVSVKGVWGYEMGES